MTDEEYDELHKRVKKIGHLSHLSDRLTFVVFGEKNWLEINWGGAALRLDIDENQIRLIYSSEINATQDAVNSLTVRRQKNWDGKK